MRRLRPLFVVLLVLCAVFYGITYIGVRNDPRNVAPSTSAPQTITIEHGALTIPSQAYIDGFDPATGDIIDPINIWQGAGAGQRVACQLNHGNTITVDNVTETDDRQWLHIATEGCNGWVLTEFVNPAAP